ncbi:MAG: hypothetical protein RL172_1906, partial [Bacteroidota bacterium]
IKPLNIALLNTLLTVVVVLIALL